MIVVSLETIRPWAYYVRLRTARNILGTLSLLLYSRVLTAVASFVVYFMGANAVLAGSVGAGAGALARVVVLWANTRIEVRRLEKIEHRKTANRSNVRSEEIVDGELSS